MILKYILNLTAVFKQHGVFNDAPGPTNTYFPIDIIILMYVQGGNTCLRSHGITAGA